MAKLSADIDTQKETIGWVGLSDIDVLLICLNCLRKHDSQMRYSGGRYGHVVGYKCSGCNGRVDVYDDDQPMSGLTFAYHGEFWSTRASHRCYLDISRIYLLDTHTLESLLFGLRIEYSFPDNQPGYPWVDLSDLRSSLSRWMDEYNVRMTEYPFYDSLVTKLPEEIHDWRNAVLSCWQHVDQSS